MDDDALIDSLLTAALAAPAPEPSDRLHAEVMRRVTRRRLSPSGVVTLAIYALVGGGACVWLLRDVPPWLVYVSLAAGGGVATSASLYATWLARLR